MTEKDTVKLDFGALATGSLAKEQEAVKRRFAAAEHVLSTPATAARQKPPRAETAPALPTQKKTKGNVGRKKSTEPIMREIFSLPASDHQLLAKAAQRCAKNGTVLYKSQIARLALVALDSLTDKQLQGIIKIFAHRELRRQQP